MSKTKRRTQLQRENDLVIMYRLSLRGYSQEDLAKRFKIDQSQVIIHLFFDPLLDLGKVPAHLADERKYKLEELRDIKFEAWQQWERSKKDKETSSQKKISAAGDDADKMEASLRRESQCGNPAFLAEVRHCIQEECKIKGLYPSRKLEQSAIDPVPVTWVETVRNRPRETKDAEIVGANPYPPKAHAPLAITEETIPPQQESPATVTATAQPPAPARSQQSAFDDLVVIPAKQLRKGIASFMDDCNSHIQESIRKEREREKERQKTQ
jgi:hypothetical protein